MAEPDVESPRSALVNGSATSQAEDPPALPPEALIDYLSRLLNVTLGATRDDLESEDSLLSDAYRDKTVERCTRFLQSSLIALYAQKNSRYEFETNGVNGNTPGRHSDERNLDTEH